MRWLIGSRTRGLLVACAVALGVARTGVGAPWYVSTNGLDSNTGMSWGQAFATIQKGIDSATAGETVWVSNGLYSVSAQLELTNGVAVRSVNGATATVIRAASSGYRVVYVTGSTGNVLDGFTVTGGDLNNFGGGIFVDGQGESLGTTEAKILHCIVTNNTAQSSSGGGIACGYGAVTLIRNCLVAANYGGHVSGISGRNGSGYTVIESCTITRNEAPGGQPAVYSEHSANTYGTNCISYDNYSPSGGANILNGNWTYTTSDPLLTGTGNLDSDPQFLSTGTGYGLSHSGGDFRLGLVSPAVDSGTNQGWMAAAEDLAGLNRILDGVVDRGAYETVTVGPLSSSFSGTPNIGLAPLTNVFTAATAGDTNGVMFTWDFDADGSFDTGWSASPVATNPYAAGIYSVVMMATNDAGDVVVVTNADYVTASPTTIYVSLDGGATLPYTSWGTAATALSDALTLAAGGATILVSNGTFSVGASVEVGKGVTVRSLNGARYTRVQASSTGYRVFYLSGASGIVLDGLTISGARVSDNGAGIYVDGQSEPLGTTEAEILHCIITNNASQPTGSGGGIACGYGAVTLIRNCLVAGNYGQHVSGVSGRGGSGYTVVESCTITGNEAPGSQPAVYSEHSANTYGTNCIAYDNYSPSGGANILNGNWTHTLSDPLLSGTGNLNADPRFFSTGSGYGLSLSGADFRLGGDSPCINVGDEQPWMIGATDLAGAPRIQGSTVDLGAYERALTGSVVILR